MEPFPLAGPADKPRLMQALNGFMSAEQARILDDTECLAGLTGQTRSRHPVTCYLDLRMDGTFDAHSKLRWLHSDRTLLPFSTSRYGVYGSGVDRLDVVAITGESPARTVAAHLAQAHAMGLTDLTKWPEAIALIRTFVPSYILPPCGSKHP